MTSWAADKQSKIKYKADKLEGGEQQEGQEPYKQLTGHVVVVHEDFTIHADTAQYYDKQGIVYATGNLQMIDQEGGIMVADSVTYNTNQRVAMLRGAITYQRDDMSFYTEELDYFVQEKKGAFHNGGRLIQKDDQLQSESGYYDDKNKLAVFTNQVALINPEYTLTCQQLIYHTPTKLAEFEGDTKIITKEGEVITTPIGGSYNTETKDALFRQATVDAKDYSLYGGLIKANQDKKYYTMDGQIELVSKKHQATITGDHSYYDQGQGIAEIYGQPMLQRRIEGDTLYMIADTFKLIEDQQKGDNKDHVIHAYNHVKIYKSDLQGKAESTEYHSIDSTIYFHHQPIFWSNGSQITAEDIHIVLQDEALDKMYINTDAFIVSEDEIGNYNQIKGKEMVAQFQDNKISFIDILGNGESIFFILDDKGTLAGMNYLRSSHIRIDMQDNALSKISFFVQPAGSFYPPTKIVPTEKQLIGFNWRINEKPTIEEFLTRKPKQLKTSLLGQALPQ
jgi:lipopolysaccharide assembly outer membrane protein LptD (OstA)